MYGLERYVGGYCTEITYIRKFDLKLRYFKDDTSINSKTITFYY